MLGIGGLHLKKAKVNIILDITNLSTVGIVESIIPAIKIAPKLKLIYNYLKSNIIDLIILIDNQGLNIPIAKIGKSLNIPVIYYLPPQVSVWGKWNAKKLSSITTMMFTPFYKDYLIYKNAGGHVEHIEHPLIKLTKNIVVQSNKGYVIAILPGSREREVKYLLPILLKTAMLINEKCNAKFLIPVASKGILVQIKKHILKYKHLNIKLTKQGNYNSYKQSKIAIVCSGTASLELALLGVPLITIYKVNPLTYCIAKLLIKKKMIALPNIILNKKVSPELIQSKAKPHIIVESAMNILNNKAIYSNMQKDFDKLKSILSNKNNINYVCSKIINELNPDRR